MVSAGQGPLPMILSQLFSTIVLRSMFCSLTDLGSSRVTPHGIWGSCDVGVHMPDKCLNLSPGPYTACIILSQPLFENERLCPYPGRGEERRNGRTGMMKK